MQITDRGGNRIQTMEAWAKLYDNPRSAHQWKEHRSAQTTAEFILRRNGIERLRSRIKEAMQDEVTFENAIPEYEVRFDEFGRGRLHDLAIYGHLSDGRSLFVGVEAKVDEPFGSVVRDVYLAAKAKQIAGVSTNAPERIENLMRLHFKKPDISVFDVRYQLLYATAGTLEAKADVSVLYIVVFKTAMCDETISAENYRDYVSFMQKANATPLKLPSTEATGHRLMVNGKELTCLYEHFDLRS